MAWEASCVNILLGSGASAKCWKRGIAVAIWANCHKQIWLKSDFRHDSPVLPSIPTAPPWHHPNNARYRKENPCIPRNYVSTLYTWYICIYMYLYTWILQIPRKMAAVLKVRGKIPFKGYLEGLGMGICVYVYIYNIHICVFHPVSPPLQQSVYHIARIFIVHGNSPNPWWINLMGDLKAFFCWVKACHVCRMCGFLWK